MRALIRCIPPQSFLLWRLRTENLDEGLRFGFEACCSQQLCIMSSTNSHHTFRLRGLSPCDCCGSRCTHRGIFLRIAVMLQSKACAHFPITLEDQLPRGVNRLPDRPMWAKAYPYPSLGRGPLDLQLALLSPYQVVLYLLEVVLEVVNFVWFHPISIADWERLYRSPYRTALAANVCLPSVMGRSA